MSAPADKPYVMPDSGLPSSIVLAGLTLEPSSPRHPVYRPREERPGAPVFPELPPLAMSIERTRSMPGGKNHFEMADLAGDEVARYVMLLTTRQPDERRFGPAPERVRTVADDGTAYEYVAIGGGACIVAAEPASSDVIVPAQVDGLRVRAIGAYAFSSLAGIETVALPDGAVDIGRQAFASCPSLRSISFAREGRHFDRAWLASCSRLSRLELPGRLEALEAGDLDIPSLRELRIGYGMPSVSPLAFGKASLARIEVDPENPVLSTDGAALFDAHGARLVAMAARRESYEVPAGVVEIGKKAFAYGTGFASVTLPEGLVRIDDFAFFRSGIASCTLPSTVREIGAKAFGQCANLVRIDVNEGVERIGEEAFAHTALTCLKLPASLCEIGENIVADSGVVAVGSGSALEISPANPELFADGKGGIYRRVDGGCELVELFGDAPDYEVLPGTVRIAPRAARRNELVRSIRFPEGLREIGDAAFVSCSSLEHVELPSTLVRIGEAAFESTSLASIELPESLEEIGLLALSVRGAQRETEVPMLRTMRIAPGNARFYLDRDILCERREDGTAYAVLYVGEGPVVTLPRDIVAIGPYAFCGARGVRELRLHDAVESIGVRGLSLGCVPTVVRLDMVRDPIEGRGSLTVRLPDHPRARSALSQTLRGPRFFAPELARISDALMLRFGTLLERGRYGVERLVDPFLLQDDYRVLYDDLIRKRLVDICVEFADSDFAWGLDRLADLGYIEEGTITGIIDAVSESGNVAMTGHLLEMKRRRFGGPRFDFEL